MARLVKREVLGPQKVYDITVEDTHNFFCASKNASQKSMILAHNCHALSKVAMDALLKPMEDTLPGSGDKRLVCLFCTTEPQKLRGTIKSRCLVFNVKEASRDDMVARLRYIATQENITIDDESLGIIFGYGDGHIRDMVTALERVSRLGSISPASVREQLGLGIVEKEYNILLHLKDSPEKSMEIVQEALMEADASSIYKGVANAALAAYRHHKGISIGLGYVEKEIAEAISTKYNPDILIQIAHSIMESNHKIDRTSLVVELLILHTQMKFGQIGKQIAPAYVNPAPPTPTPTPTLPTTEQLNAKTVLSKDAQEAENRKWADEAFEYGGKAAKGLPDRPAQEDPVKTHRNTMTPIRGRSIQTVLPDLTKNLSGGD